MDKGDDRESIDEDAVFLPDEEEENEDGISPTVKALMKTYVICVFQIALSNN